MIKKIQKNMNKKGFTLVELIIVIAVMAILAAIVLPRMAGITDSFKESADERVCETIAREIEVMLQLGNVPSPANGTVASLLPENTMTPDSGGGFYYFYSSDADSDTSGDQPAITVYVGVDSDGAASEASNYAGAVAANISVTRTNVTEID